MTGIGLFFMGPYFVVFPLLVRDYYGGSADQLSLLFAMFPVGAVAASMLLLRIGRLPRRGLALALAQLVAACALLVIGIGLPFWGTLLGSTVWGLAGGIFNNSSRSVFQENAPESHRARVLAVYSLGLFGGGARLEKYATKSGSTNYHKVIGTASFSGQFMFNFTLLPDGNTILAPMAPLGSTGTARLIDIVHSQQDVLSCDPRGRETEKERDAQAVCKHA